MDTNYACGQTEYPTRSSEDPSEDGTVTCKTGSIQCFVFATLGQVGGRCSNGDAF